jgi:hypothetical protein
MFRTTMSNDTHTMTSTKSPELNATRFWNTATESDWRVYDGRGRCLMFGLSEERAREFARHYRGGHAAKG